ncbi:hypothetical protein U1Q18_049993, partial [Sarracenia purpurea var. burkii]
NFFATLEREFGVSRSSICFIIPEVCRAIILVLKKYIHTPNTTEEWENASKQFEERWNEAKSQSATGDAGTNLSLKAAAKRGHYFATTKRGHKFSTKKSCSTSPPQVCHQNRNKMLVQVLSPKGDAGRNPPPQGDATSITRSGATFNVHV